MNKCENEKCGCMTWERYLMEDGKRVCAYCEVQYREAKKLMESFSRPTPREYNNLTWLIKHNNVTVRNWCKLHGFEYTLVAKVLRKVAPYDRTDIHVMTKTHFKVIMALCDDGYTDTLVNEEYVTHV